MAGPRKNSLEARDEPDTTRPDSFARLREASRTSLVYGLFAVLFGLLQLGGWFQFLDNELADARSRLTTRPASEQVVLVEIDARSLAELDTWPWPRRHYATALDRLMAAGAIRVAFDIDYSAASTPGNDLVFEDALARHGKQVLLAAFQQQAITADGDIYLQPALPLPRFRQHTGLVTINVRPAADGLIRDYATAGPVGDTTLPAIGAVLAGQLTTTPRTFAIDYGILPDTIPHLSFVDVLNGTFEPNIIAGRAVIIGATAVELGDRLAVPVWRNLAGPVVNVLAAESLLQARAIHGIGNGMIIVSIGMIAILLGPAFANLGWRPGAALVVGLATAVMIGATVVQAAAPLSIDLAAILITLLATYGAGLATRMDRQGLRLLLQELASSRRRALLIRIVEQSADGILILNEVGEVETGNPAAAGIFGNGAMNKGTRVAELFDAGDEETARFLHLLSTADSEAADSTLREVAGKRADGANIPLELLVGEVTVRGRTGRRRGAEEVHRNLICTVRDITERKRIEALKREALEQSLQAARAKSDFLSSMNHGLRTPLNHIIGFAEMLREGYMGQLNENQHQYANTIATSGKDLLHLIGEILEYADLEDGRSKLEEKDVPIGALIKSCLDAVSSRANDASITLVDHCSDDALPTLSLDRQMIEQALLNILSNAIKFNNPGGSVEVTAHHAESGDFIITITDTGVGMSEQQVKFATQAFSRVEEAFKRTHAGYGLGLPLAKSLVEFHGGTLRLTSTVGEGTAVTMRFPSRRVIAAAQSQAASS